MIASLAEAITPATEMEVPKAAQTNAPVAAPVTHHAALPAAYEAAGKDGALVLVSFHAAWCGPCRKLTSEVFESVEFRDHGGPLHHVGIDIDAEPKTAERFRVSGIPDLLLLTGDGKIVARRKGYVALEDFSRWVADARTRAKRGEWEGIAEAGAVREFMEGSAGVTLSTNDLARLVELLGNPEPSERIQTIALLASQRDAAVPGLIAAVAHPYLGVRIGVSDTLRQLARDLPAYDPWAAPGELTNAVAALREWWQTTGSLPERKTVAPLDMLEERRLALALEHVASDEAVWRTEGMSQLVQLGAGVLPAVREATRRAERAGNQRAVWGFEEVRWTILIPAEVEGLTGGCRRELARGASPERQAAVDRLTKAGKAAVPVLTTLMEDSDPLVQEAALKTLGKIGGPDAVAAMAVLLRSGDSNLRMTAAQALGATGKKDAAAHLAGAVEDSNELVACAAVKALEQIRAKDQKPALVQALRDPRWRVRAAAAETIGKLSLNDAAGELKKLLADADGFVVKTALEALRQLSVVPEAAELKAMVKRLPALKGVVVEFLTQDEKVSATTTVTELYRDAVPADRAAIWRALAVKRRSRSDGEVPTGDDAWREMLADGLTAPEAGIRREAAEFLLSRSAKLAAEFVGATLQDPDELVRDRGARAAMQIVASDLQITAAPGEKKPPRANAKKQQAEWHTQLQTLAPTLPVVLALYLTGDGTAELPAVATWLGRPVTENQQREDLAQAVPVILKRLPWPAGGAVLAAIHRNPDCLAPALMSLAQADAVVRAELLQADRLVPALAALTGEASEKAVTALLKEENAVLVGPALEKLRESPQPILRAASVYRQTNDVERALQDADVGVRRAALQSVARSGLERERLEELVAPLLADESKDIVRLAAAALLEPEVRTAAGLGYELTIFRYGNATAWSRTPGERADDRPLSPLEARPEFLDLARRRLATAEPELQAVLAVLLAQFGDFSGIDEAVRLWQSGTEKQVPAGLLTGLGLSRNPKYAPVVRAALSRSEDGTELPKLLKALRGMTGDEARRLRADINKQMRERGN